MSLRDRDKAAFSASPRPSSLRGVVAGVARAHGRYRQLRTLLDELAEIAWWHPAWWGLCAVTALFEEYGDTIDASELYALFLSANGGPRTDTFMGRKARNLPESPAARIARAVTGARAAVEILAALDGSMPEQPLICCLGWEHGWLRRRALPGSADNVAFLTGDGVYLARVSRGSELAIAAALTAGELPRLDLDADQPVPATIAVSLLEAPLDIARHIHRQAWSSGGGPWLGLTSAPPYQVVTTCHLAVDGYGHARVTSELFRRLDALADVELAITHHLARIPPSEALARLTGTFSDGRAARSWHSTQPAGVAGAVRPGNLAFARAAYAFGRALARVYQSQAERRRARYSPTFQVPVAPRLADAEKDDAERRRRRVIHGLLALRMHAGEFEPFEAFSARLPGLLAREMTGDGVLTRVAQAAASIPVPRAWRRRYLAAPTQPSVWVPPAEILAGRGDLSSLRFLDGEVPVEPIFAVSAPPLQVSQRDHRGAAVLTLLHHDGFVAATVSGTGLAASHAGAAHILAVWSEELERLGCDE